MRVVLEEREKGDKIIYIFLHPVNRNCSYDVKKKKKNPHPWMWLFFLLLVAKIATRGGFLHP